MVAKFLDDNKPKVSLKKWFRTVSHFIDLIQVYFICQMLAKCSGVESERTVFKCIKRKQKVLCCVHLLHKALLTCKIRTFHVAVVQRRLRNVQKIVMHVQSCCFAYTAISRKVVGKSARDNPERYCGWLWGHCSSKKFERMVREATDICLRVLKESNKSRFDSFSRYEQCINHIPYYLSGLSSAHFFRQPFSK